MGIRAISTGIAVVLVAAVLVPAAPASAGASAVQAQPSASSLTFGAPQPRAVNTPGADLSPLLSCTTDGFCIDTDAQRNVMTFDGTSWTRKLAALRRPLIGLSCISSTYCLGVDAENTVRWNGHAFVQVAPSPGLLSLNRTFVSCGSSTFCLAAGDQGWSRWNGSEWSPIRDYPGAPSFEEITGLSCSPGSICLSAGSPMRFDGTSWSDVPFPGDHLAVLSCQQRGGICLALDDGGHHAYTFEGADLAWHQAGKTGPFPTGTDHTDLSVSCSTGSLCVATLHRQASRFNNIRWTPPVTFDATPSATPDNELVSQAACGTTTSCEATLAAPGGLADATRYDSGGVWQQPVDIDPNRGVEFQTFECASASSCFGATPGYAYHFDGHTWSVGKKLARSGGTVPNNWMNVIQDISCASATFCLALLTGGAERSGQDKFSSGWAIWDGSAWVAVHANVVPSHLVSVSCVSATFCAAVGRDENSETLDGPPDAWLFDGVSWHRSPVRIAEQGPLTTVSCASTTFCATAADDLDGTGTFVTFDGAQWTDSTSVATPIADLSCASTTFCVAVDATNRPALYDGSTWRRSPVISGVSSLGIVTCHTSQACYAADTDNDAVTRYASGWQLPVPVTFPTALSCPRPSFCAAISGHTRLITAA